MVIRKTRRATRHTLKTNRQGFWENDGVGNRRRVVGLGPYSVGVIALGALVILAVLVVWGTSQLISSADPVERQFVSVPDLPALSEMPSALVPVLTEADQALRRSVAESAESGTIAQAAGRLGQIYHANNYGENAALCYELATTKDAENPRWLYLLAALRQERGENTSVTELLERTVDLAPEYAPAWLKLADNQFKQGLFDRARASYERRLVLAVGDPYANLGLARLALARSEWELAEGYLERVTKAEAFAAVYRLLASVHDHFGHQQEREAALRRAEGARRFAPAPDPWVTQLLDHNYNVESLLLQVSRYSSVGQNVLAQRTFERAQRLEPNNPEVYVVLGQHASDATQARQAFQKAVSLAPDHASARVGLGEMLLRENRPQEAEAVLQEAIDLDPELAAAHKNLGLAAAAAGRFQEAVEHVRQAIVLSPNTVSFHYSLASVLREAGRREEAEVELHRILERWPSHPGAERALAALGGSR